MTVASTLSINPSLSATSPPSSPSPTRSRHRRLSYLRHYTHSRLSSHHNSNSNDESESQAPPVSTNSRSASDIPSSNPQHPPGSNSPLSPSETNENSGNEQVNSDSHQEHSSSFRRLSAFRRQRGHSGPSSTPQANTAPARHIPLVEAASMSRQNGTQASAMTQSRSTNRMGSTLVASQDHTGSLEGVGSVVNPVDLSTIPTATSESIPQEQPALAEDGNQQHDGRAKLPMIRLFPHQDVRPGRPSLHFTPITRTLPANSSIIRVGRYSEREGAQMSNPTVPSDAPIGFKSKVVSRKHCEFLFSDGQWHIKDVKSSSGTFLNHIRLSQPNSESRLFPVKDGDVVQLGIDFRGGEEPIFRCVKIRVECNRSWQKRPNNFNKTRHAQLQSLSRETNTDTKSSGECSICLGNVTPCQSLFVAACAHVWHFKCIRPLLISRIYPSFTCPNCRAVTDLEAEVDQVDEDWDEEAWEAQDAEKMPTNDTIANVPVNGTPQDPQHSHDVGATTGEIEISDAAPAEEPDAIMTDDIAPPDPSETGDQSQVEAYDDASPNLDAVNIPNATMSTANHSEEMLRAPTPEAPADGVSAEGPLTPRNDAGPFVFDGSAGRSSGTG